MADSGPTTVYIEDIEVGQTARFEKRLDEDAVRAFAEISGDANPVHLDADYAASTRFGRPIVHGLLTASLISTVVGTRLPGMGSIYVSQTLRFRKPVYVGDVVRAEVTVREVHPQRRRVLLDTRCYVGETLVLEGEAVMLAPSREKAGQKVAG